MVNVFLQSGVQTHSFSRACKPILSVGRTNSKFAACKKKVQKILAYIGSIHYLCCKKEEPACWRGKLEEKPGQAQAGYQSSQLRCKL